MGLAPVGGTCAQSSGRAAIPGERGRRLRVPTGHGTGAGWGWLTLPKVALTALPFPSLLLGWRPLREPWEGGKETRPSQKAAES